MSEVHETPVDYLAMQQELTAIKEREAQLAAALEAGQAAARQRLVAGLPATITAHGFDPRQILREALASLPPVAKKPQTPGLYDPEVPGAVYRRGKFPGAMVERMTALNIPQTTDGRAFYKTNYLKPVTA